MDTAPLSESSGRLLLALRHALADPLSAAVLKLDLVDRRLRAPSGADPSWVTERVLAVQSDLGTATRLLDLLIRLAEIAGERPEETSLGDVCRTANVPLEEASGVASLPLRHRASAEAIRSVASFLGAGDAATKPVARAASGDGCMTLTVQGSRSTPDGRPERLLELPHGTVDAEALFVARAAVEADGGRLELSERGDCLVATFSWPLPEKGVA